MRSAPLTARARAAPPRGEEAAWPRGGGVGAPGPSRFTPRAALRGHPERRSSLPADSVPSVFEENHRKGERKGWGERATFGVLRPLRAPGHPRALLLVGRSPRRPSVRRVLLQLLLGPGGLSPPGAAGRCRPAAASATGPGLYPNGSRAKREAQASGLSEAWCEPSAWASTCRMVSGRRARPSGSQPAAKPGLCTQ